MQRRTAGEPAVTPRRGDVVLVRFPFASGAGGKLRPALVVQNDRDNQRLANVVLAAITTRTHHSGEPTQRLIDPQAPEGANTGLRHVSVVSCENLATVEKQLIVKRLGGLSPSLMNEVDECLKAALGLV
ncbi:MAG: transcriptional regulator [Planctomycetota bacterium]|nr:MAG: transcriptional regulator [Planctomycetota bacterium]